MNASTVGRIPIVASIVRNDIIIDTSGVVASRLLLGMFLRLGVLAFMIHELMLLCRID